MENNIIQQQLFLYKESKDVERQSYHRRIRNPKLIRDCFINSDVSVVDYEVELDDFIAWRKRHMQINKHYRKIGDVGIEKLLEHYLTDTILEVKKEDVFIDVAASGSPWARILRERGCEAYRLDVCYERGINGYDIGTDAGDIELDDEFADVMALHCAYECFSSTADQRFIKEAERVLKRGGRVGIVPLYVDHDYCIITSPYCDQRTVEIDNGARRVWREDEYRVPFSRHYSPEVFVSRVMSCMDRLKGKIYYIKNLENLASHYPGQRIYCDFLFVGTKDS